MLISGVLVRFGRPVLLAAVVLLAACSGSDGEVVDLGSGVASDESDNESDVDASSSTSTEPSTTTSTVETTTSSTLSAAEADEALGEDLMATLLAYTTARDACTSDIVECDFDESLAPFLGGDQLVFTQNWYEGIVEERKQYRINGNFYVYRRHVLAFEKPETYALETCHEATGGDVLRVNDDGSVENIGDLATDLSFQQFAIEREADGSFTIVDNVTNPEQVEGDSCDEFRDQ